MGQAHRKVHQLPPASAHRLPDLLGHGLRLVICGSAAGRRSAEVGAYYAGRGNKFWPVLHRIGLTPRLLRPQEFPQLLGYGIGLTDMAKHYAGGDAGIRRRDDDAEAVRRKILRYRPRVLAFNGKRAACRFLGRSVEYGLQTERLGDTAMFVLPSTAGLAAGWWDEAQWRALAAFLASEPKDQAATGAAARIFSST